jgi:hypothetical protein
MRLIAPIVFLALSAGSAFAGDARPVGACMSAAEIREAVAARKLVEPMAAVRNAVRLTHAEPLRSQLCRSKDGLQYQLTLLRRDGKIVRLTINAANGVLIASRIPPERRLKPPFFDRAKIAPFNRFKPPSADRAKAAALDRGKTAPQDRTAVGSLARGKTELSDRSKTEIADRPLKTPKRPDAGISEGAAPAASPAPPKPTPPH